MNSGSIVSVLSSLLFLSYSVLNTFLQDLMISLFLAKNKEVSFFLLCAFDLFPWGTVCLNTLKRIRDLSMRYINLHFTYLLT